MRCSASGAAAANSRPLPLSCQPTPILTPRQHDHLLVVLKRRVAEVATATPSNPSALVPGARHRRSSRLSRIGRESPPKHCLAPTPDIAARRSFQTMIWSGTSVRGPIRRPSTERGMGAWHPLPSRLHRQEPCGGVPGPHSCQQNPPAGQRLRTNAAPGSVPGSLFAAKRCLCTAPISLH